MFFLVLAAPALAQQPRQVYRSIEDLKKSPAPQVSSRPAKPEETSGKVAPVDPGKGLDIGIGTRGAGEVTSPRTSPTGFLGTNGNTPVSWGPGKGPGESWKLDPERGKPKVNLPLTIGSLVVVIIVAYGALKVYSLYTGVDAAGRGLPRGKLMNIREKQMLGPNKQLCIVELPGKIVLLGITDTEMRVLTEIDPEKIPQGGLAQETGESAGTPSASSYLMDVLLRRDRQGGKS